MNKMKYQRTTEEQLRACLFDNQDNVELLKELVQECNSWNGSLESYEVYENDEDFFQTCFNDNVMEAVRAVSFGEWNYSDEYVKFNGYGNLESMTDYEYDEELKSNASEIIETSISELDNYRIEEILMNNSIDITDYEEDELSKESEEV